MTSQAPAGPVVRFATIGTNFIVDAFLKVAADVPGFQLSAVYSRSNERAAEFVAKHSALHPGVLLFTSLDELAGCADVDAVYVASPTSEHARQAKLLLRAGKHVLVEKPACSHAAELQGVIDAAKESGKAFMEAMRPLKTPAFAAVRSKVAELTDAGHPIGHFSGAFCQLSSRWPAYLRGENPNAFLPDLSNGALMDLGCYAIYSAVALMGPPDSVTYAPMMLPTGVDAAGTLLLRYGGSLATLVISKSSHGFNHSEIHTDAGTIRIGNLGDYNEVHFRCKGGDEAALTPMSPPGHSNMIHEVEAFVSMVQRGDVQDDVLTWELSLQVARTLDKARDDAGIVFPADASRGV